MLPRQTRLPWSGAEGRELPIALVVVSHVGRHSRRPEEGTGVTSDPEPLSLVLTD